MREVQGMQRSGQDVVRLPLGRHDDPRLVVLEGFEGRQLAREQ